MLVSQWRELIAIKRQWEKGTLIHPLVSYVKDYDKAIYGNFVCKVLNEMDRRNIKHNEKLEKELYNFCNGNVTLENYKEHDDEYLKICYYNLKEKHLRGIISKDEWSKVENQVE